LKGDLPKKPLGRWWVGGDALVGKRQKVLRCKSRKSTHCKELRGYANPLRWRAALRRSSRLMRFGLGAGGVEGVSLVFAGFGASA